MLKFWGEMAEVSVQHLKPHDLVYVSGRLGSYLKDGSSVLYEVHSATFLFSGTCGVWGMHSLMFETKLL